MNQSHHLRELDTELSLDHNYYQQYKQQEYQVLNILEQLKNLLIDWKIGQEWFWDCLIDADLASNSASWQWVAGSGADAAPYFRIFNPTTQSEKFDPNGKYIKKWLPELKDLPNNEIHNPKDRSNYYPQITCLKESRNRALELYRRL